MIDINQLTLFQRRFIEAYETMYCSGICSYMNSFYQEWHFYATVHDKMAIKELCDSKETVFEENWRFQLKDWQQMNEEIRLNIGVTLD